MTLSNKLSLFSITGTTTPVSDVVDAPTIGTATAGTEQATVPFTAAATGGAATSFTATSTPGSITATSATSPITVTGLTGGTSYTFKVHGVNSSGTWSAVQSAASNSVTPTVNTSFESIATVTVGSGGAANVEFTSIPSTYTHLQVRAILKTTTSATKDYEVIYMRLNGDTGSNYALHQITGNGTTAAAGNGANQSLMYAVYGSKSGLADAFGGGIVDILDYKDTNKYKTLRNLTGVDMNGMGELGLISGLWRNTNAITSILFYPPANNIAQYSHFALYGIRSA